MNLSGGIVGWATKRSFGRIRPDPDDWLVYRRVLRPGGAGMPNLRVSVFDKDLLLDHQTASSSKND